MASNSPSRSVGFEHLAPCAAAVTRAFAADPAGFETATSPGGQTVPVVRVSGTEMPGIFGATWAMPADCSVVFLRDNLEGRVRRGVLAHELLHVDDFARDRRARHWIRRELNATIPLLRRTPLDLLAVFWATISDPDRRAAYRRRFRVGH